MSRTMHANSLDAYHEGRLEDFTKRQREILGAFAQRVTLTDRECLAALGYADMNAVRPRITELIDQGVLREIGGTSCPVTKKRVRVCEIAPRKPADYLPGFNLGGHRDDG